MVASIMAPLVQGGRAGLLRLPDRTGHITDAWQNRPVAGKTSSRTPDGNLGWQLAVAILVSFNASAAPAKAATIDPKSGAEGAIGQRDQRRPVVVVDRLGPA
jgi:hypothetical protein